jgi:hypothetical protein
VAAWLSLIRQSWRFLACVCLLQGAHAAYYGFSAIYWQEAGYSPLPWAICGHWAWWRKWLSLR